MESKELTYILLIIILILNLLNKKESFINLLNKNNLFNKNELFLNLRKDRKKKITKCCKKNCYDKPSHLRDKDCEKNKEQNIKNIKKQLSSKFKNIPEFYNKRYPFEKEPLGDNKPLIEQPKRHELLQKSIKKKEYMPAYKSPFNFIKNSGKPGFYIKLFV